MMKRLFLLLFFNTLFFSALAQKNQFEFTGTLKIEGLNAITYKLNFELLTDGSLKGSSTSDFKGENLTTSKISGKVDFEKQEISFKEIENLMTKSEEDSSRFCYVNVQSLPIEFITDKNLIRGAFQGNFPNGEFCAEGEINLIGNNLFDFLKAEIPEADPIVNTQIDSTESMTIQSPDIIKEPKGPLENGNILGLDWQSETLRLDLWDAFEEDNDRVNIYVNNELKHKSLLVRNAKSTLKFPIPSNGLIIKIEAETEGSNPPNTVNAQFIEKGQVKSIVTKLKKGEFVEIQIQRSND